MSNKAKRDAVEAAVERNRSLPRARKFPGMDCSYPDGLPPVSSPLCLRLVRQQAWPLREAICLAQVLALRTCTLAAVSRIRRTKQS